MSTTAPSTIRATVSDATIYYLFVLSSAMEPQMGIAVDFTSRVDETLLAKALRLLVDIEPPLGYRFAPESPGLVWERVGIPSEDAILPVQTTTDAETDLHTFLASTFDECAGPQVRGLLLRAPDHDTLALQVSHVAVDGRGAVETLYRLCELHRTLAEDPEWDPPFNSASIRDFVAAGVQGSFRDKIASISTLATSLATGDWGAAPDSGVRGTDAYALAFIEPELLDVVRHAGRVGGATVNDLLLTAFYLSLRETLDPAVGAKTSISVGADLRRLLSIDRGWGLSNFAAFVGLRLVASERESFDATLVQVRDTMQPLKDDALRRLALSRVMADKMGNGWMRGPWRRSMVRMSGVMLKAMSGEDGSVGPVLTNIGEIDAERVRFGGGSEVSEARWFVQMGHGASLPLGISTFRGRAQLCASVDPTAWDPAVTQAILSGTVEALREWASEQELSPR